MQVKQLLCIQAQAREIQVNTFFLGLYKVLSEMLQFGTKVNN